MTEYDLIRRLAGIFPRHPGQVNATFTSDAELVPIGGSLWALTVDDFSPEEDLFSSQDPEVLGANVAVATLSDLFACGAEPRFFLCAVCLPPDIDPAFADGLARGVRDVLGEAGCHMLGGDVGAAATWRFCGVALGPVACDPPLTRVMPSEPQRLWVTGELGDANLAAFCRAPTPRFELRWDAAQAIRRLATACIDTSGGLVDAAWLLAAVSPGVRLEIDLSQVPLCPGLPALAQARGIPAQAGLVGGAGEYELLFATTADLPAAQEEALRSLGATAIGSASPGGEGGLYLGTGGVRWRPVTQPPPCAREAGSVEAHIAQVIEYARSLVP